MTTTTVHCNRRPACGGFTLAEVLIAMAITGIIATAVFASWGFIARSTVSIAHYTEMNSVGRAGLEVFARDVRMARGVRDFSETGMTLVMDSDAEDLIYYTFTPESNSFVRERDGTEKELFGGVEELILSRFTVLRTQAINDLETKQIQLELRMSRRGNARDTSKKIVSARYIMRNKRVST